MLATSEATVYPYFLKLLSLLVVSSHEETSAHARGVRLSSDHTGHKCGAARRTIKSAHLGKYGRDE